MSNPAILQIRQASRELAAQLGKQPEDLTDEEAAEAIRIGEQRHSETKQ